MKHNKSILALAAVAVFGSAAAHAGPVIPFDIKNPSGTLVAGADSLDWNAQGSGLAKGIGPFNGNVLLPVGTNFEFLYQANLVTVGGGVLSPSFAGLDTTSNGTADAGKSFEFTAVAKFMEVVSSSGFIGTNASAIFSPVADPGNKVAIYYDTAMNANTATGTGFDDGTKIAQFTVDAGVPGFMTLSSFTSTSATTGQGAALIHASLDPSSGDFVDPAFLEGISRLIFDVDYQSNLNVPAGTSSTTDFHVGGDATFPNYAVGANDILFKVDGDNQFTAQIPEPGSLALLGLGLAGLGLARRRK